MTFLNTYLSKYGQNNLNNNKKVKFCLYIYNYVVFFKTHSNFKKKY